MVFSQQTDEKVPATRQLIINNTAVQPADERHGIVYANGIPNYIMLRSISEPEHFLKIEVSPMIVIGRKQSMRDSQVDVDLADFNGSEAGVSRYHAMMLALDSYIYLKDIDSLNGSLLNGKQLMASKEYIITEGDIVAFGRVEFSIEFLYD